MKVKLFTHTDLDGVGCSILGQYVYPDISVEYCNYDDINEKVENYINTKEYQSYDMTYITDISVSENIAQLITDNIDVEKITLLDHHKTAYWLNDYSWAFVTEYIESDVKHCGTCMFYYHLLDTTINKDYKNLTKDGIFNFVEVVRRYDTWEWKEKYNDLFAKQTNDLLYLLGREAFVNNALYQLKQYQEFALSEQDLMLLKNNQEKIDKYIESKSKQIIIKEILGYKAGVVFAEQYHSELGNKLSEMNPELDFIVLINPSYSISYRTVKDNVNLGIDIAKAFGGGGHPKAAGSPITDEVRNKIVNLVFGL